MPTEALNCQKHETLKTTKNYEIKPVPLPCRIKKKLKQNKDLI